MLILPQFEHVVAASADAPVSTLRKCELAMKRPHPCLDGIRAFLLDVLTDGLCATKRLLGGLTRWVQAERPTRAPTSTYRLATDPTAHGGTVIAPAQPLALSTLCRLRPASRLTFLPPRPRRTHRAGATKKPCAPCQIAPTPPSLTLRRMADTNLCAAMQRSRTRPGGLATLRENGE